MDLDRISLDYLLDCLNEEQASSTANSGKHLAQQVLSNIPPGAISSTGGILVLCPLTWSLQDTLRALESLQEERRNGDVMCSLLSLAITVLSQTQPSRERPSVNINTYEEVVLLFSGGKTPELLQSLVNRSILYRVITGGHLHKLSAHFMQRGRTRWFESFVRDKGGHSGEGVRRYIETRARVALKELLIVFSKEAQKEVNQAGYGGVLLRAIVGEEAGFFRTEAVVRELQRVVHKAVAKGLIADLCEDVIRFGRDPLNGGKGLSPEEKAVIKELKAAAVNENCEKFTAAFDKLSESFGRFDGRKSVQEALLHLFLPAVWFVFVVQRLDRPALFPAFCTLAGMLNKLKVIKTPGELDQIFKTGLGMLPAQEPAYVWALVSAFLPAYQRISRFKDMSMRPPLMHPVSFARTKLVSDPDKSYEVVLFGGGPSSVLPMVAASINGTKVRFFGVPSESFVVRGRDPQKTLATMLLVAQRYATYEVLQKQTLLYYRYIAALITCFGHSASEATKLAYSIAGPMRAMGVAADVVLYCEAYDDFIPMTREEDGRLYLKSKKGKTIRVYKSTDKMFSYEDGFEMDIEEDVIIGIPDARAKTERVVSFRKGLHFFRYLPRLHGDFHYLTLFSSVWEDPVSFSEARSTFKHVVNRASFEYPTDSVVDTMTALNYDYIEAVASCLQRAHKPLNDLEKRMLRLLTDYLERSAQKRRECLSQDRFVLFGCGRASGEMARRLAHDELRYLKNKATCGLPIALYDKIDPAVIVTEQARLRGIIAARKKFVVVVDHKRIDFARENADEELHTLNESGSYRDFLLEITKGSFMPTVTGKDLAYYKELREHMKNKSFAGNPSVITYLDKLCSQERAVSNFILRTHTTRDIAMDSPEMSRLLGLNPAETMNVDKWVVLRVGGAKHVGEHGPKKYDFLRINNSHFRSENLCFLSTFMRRDSSQFASLEQVLASGEF